jgi:hypothetical protein
MSLPFIQALAVSPNRTTKRLLNLWNAAAWSAMFLAGTAFSQSLPPEIKANLDNKIKQLRSLSADPTIVAAVKAHNSNMPAEDKAMTNEKWSKLTVLDPYVRSFTRNPLGIYLKSKKDDQISECFVSGADGTKVAFLSKTTSWNHADKDKHKVPMSGKTYIGPVALDESSGIQEIQVGLPVVDNGKPIGSVVVGINISKLH